MGLLGRKARTKKNQLWATFDLCFFIFSRTFLKDLGKNSSKDHLIGKTLQCHVFELLQKPCLWVFQGFIVRNIINSPPCKSYVQIVVWPGLISQELTWNHPNNVHNGQVNNEWKLDIWILHKVTHWLRLK